MSDLRLQNLLQSMRQNAVQTKDSIKLSDVRFSAPIAQFPDNLQSLLTAQIEVIQAKQNFELKNAVLAQLRIVDVSPKDKEVQFVYKGENFTLSLKDIPQADDILRALHGGQRLAITVEEGAASKAPILTLTLIDDGSAARIRAGVGTAEVVAAAKDTDKAETAPVNIPPLRDDDFALMVGRLKRLEDIEQKIDELREKIPRSDVNSKSVLRSFSVDLMAQPDVLIKPQIERQVIALENIPVPQQATMSSFAAVDIVADEHHLVQALPLKVEYVATVIAQYAGEDDGDNEVFQAKTNFSIHSVVIENEDAAYLQDELVDAPRMAVIAYDNLPKITAHVEAYQVSYDPQQSVSIRDILAQDIRSPEIIVIDELRGEKAARHVADNPFLSTINVIDERPVDARQLISGQAAGITVRVIGETPKGEKIVQPEWPNWPAHKALVFAMKEPRDMGRFHAIETGDVLAVELPQIQGDEDGAVQSTGRSDGRGGSASHIQSPASISPFMQQADFVQGFAQLFGGGLENFTAALASSPTVLSNQMMVPNMARPSEIPSALLFLVAALRSGDVGQMFDDKMEERFAKLGKLDALRSFMSRQSESGDMLSRQEQGRSAGEWRSVMLPMLSDGQISAIALHWTQQGGGGQGQGQEGQEDAPKRFVLDFNLNVMGDVQLDGLYQDRKLNVALRLEKMPSEAMAARIRAFYFDALDQVGLSGDLRFQTVKPHAVLFTPVYADGSAMDQSQ